MKRVLILGGTTEASALAAALAEGTRFAALLSFAGATRAPRPPPVPWRVGGFGGVEGLAAFLQDEAIDLLIDATHPFAAHMKRNAAEAAAITRIALLAVRRPEWRPGEGDRWLTVPDMLAAATALGQTPRRVLLTIGQKDLAAFQAAPWHHYVVRSVDAPEEASLPPQAEVIAARGPFRLPDELDLLDRTSVSAIVTKNSGGDATSAKLAAARQRGVEVVMVARPPILPGVETVPDAAGALRWLAAHAGTERGV